MVHGSQLHQEYVGAPQALTGRPTGVVERCDRLPSGYVPFKLDGNPGEAPYLAYLRSRNLSDIDISLFRLGYSSRGEYAGRIIVPSFDALGSVNIFVARSISKPMFGSPYKMPECTKDVIFNEHLVDWTKEVLLVEGSFDAMAIGTQAIPLLGKFLQPSLTLRLLRSVPLVRICLDSDAMIEAWELAECLLSYGITCSVVMVPGKDPAEAGISAVLTSVERAPIISDQVSYQLARAST